MSRQQKPAARSAAAFTGSSAATKSAITGSCKGASIREMFSWAISKGPSTIATA
ncbi:MAG: hypothetical protein ACM3JP_00765 [Betaproteobacteria bacterium]